MSVYEDHLLPHIINMVMNNTETRRIRPRVCAGLSGQVVELGFGTGHNLPYLPADVTRLLAVEPSGVGVRLGRKRIDASPVPVDVVGLDGERLPLEDASVDTALSTWTLCTIPDAVTAVREVRRVLKPGGTLHFVEHGSAPDDGVRRWQQRLNGIQQRLAGGCNLDRDIPALIEAGGMRIVTLERYYGKGQPKPLGYEYEGVAVA